MERIKIVLVDDELTSRNTIKNYLEGNEIYEVIADFSNAKSALEWCRKNKIDILLCDMHMPEIDGVELMRNIHIIEEYLPVVVISGYDDFNYVRGSLVNGAANYLLKHELSKGKLLDVLDQVREKYRIVPAEGKVYQKKGYCIYDEAEFSPEKIKQMSDDGEIDFECRNIAPIAISPDYKLHTGTIMPEYKQDICRAIIDMMGQILSDKYPYIVYITKKNHMILLLSFKEERSMMNMINQQSNLVRRLQKQIVRMLDLTVTVINGEIYGDISIVIEKAYRMDKLLADKLYLGGNRVVSFAVAKEITYYQGALPENLMGQFEFELKNHMENCLNTAYEMLELMERNRYAWDWVYQSCKRMLKSLKQEGFLKENEERDLLETMGEYEEYGQFRDTILEVFHQNIRNSRLERKKQYSETVGKVIEYIQQNIASDISLEKCAEYADTSYTYLSREFKKETGMRFVEFLNHQRVNKAKSLLIRKDISMKEIVESAGFRNYNYFFKVFKEMEGMTPSEFAAKKQRNS